MSFWSAYKGLAPKTRAMFGIGIMAWAGLGLMLSPIVEDRMGMVPTKEEKDELDRKIRIQVHTVEKDQ